MKRLIAWVACVGMALGTLYAVPSRRVKKTVRQSDGTELTILLRGDEAFHYYATADGIPVKQASDGAYYYAEWSADTLRAAGRLAHDEAQRTEAERAWLDGAGDAVKQGLRTAWSNRAQVRNRQRVQRAADRRRATLGKNGADAIIGQKKGLVILVNFTDVKHSSTDPQQTFDAMVNEVGYKENGQYGSVHDYFHAQSYGQFSLNFDVVGPVALSQRMAYYGADSGGEGNDIRPGTMVAEACKLADSQVNFADYDWDGDGIVEQVYVIYAGYGQASGASSNTIWPHEWELYSSDYGKVLELDGVTINTYACGSELAGTSGKVIDGIGTMCHEFSHCLGLPDFYDTDGSGNFGMDCWSVMDYGCYNNDGRTPAAYTAYERAFCGWLTPVELNAPQKVRNMKALTDAGEAYIIYNEANKNEYYLLENRQQAGWDSGGYGHGLLVVHVDYDESAWSYNVVNNTASRQRMTIIPADNAYTGTVLGLAGDPFPGRKGNTALTDTSLPAASLYNLNIDGRRLMGKPIENIAETQGLIGFDFMGGVFVPVPDGLTATGLSDTGFTARWNAVEEAESYTLQLATYGQEGTTDGTVLHEDFAKFVTSALGTKDISTGLDAYTAVSGWTGSKLFTSSQGLKMGAANVMGWLTTPLLSGQSGSDVTVSVSALSYSVSASVQLAVQLLGADGSILSEQTCTVLADGMRTYECSFGEVDHAYSIRLYPKARLYVSDLKITAGQGAQITEIADVSTNSYTFTQLDGALFGYRVKAVTSEGSSDWSEWKKVDLVTALDEVSADGWHPTSLVDVYAPNGVWLKRTEAARWAQGLPKGIYLLRCEGETRKVAIR